MSDSYYNNDSGGESFDDNPPEPMDGADTYADTPYDLTNITEGGMGGGTSDNCVDRLSPPSNPRGSVLETRLQNGGKADAAE